MINLTPLRRFLGKVKYGIYQPETQNKQPSPTVDNIKREWKFLSPDELEQGRMGLSWDVVNYCQQALRQQQLESKAYWLTVQDKDHQELLFQPFLLYRVNHIFQCLSQRNLRLPSKFFLNLGRRTNYHTIIAGTYKFRIHLSGHLNSHNICDFFYHLRKYNSFP